MAEMRRPEARGAHSGRVNIGLRNSAQSISDSQRVQGQPATSIVKNAREAVRVSIERSREHDYIDVRLYSHNSVHPRAARKALTVRPDCLPQVTEASRLAKAEARDRGLLS